MADQKITELQIKTSTGINLTDYLLGIDSAEGYQMLVSDIAKKIVEDYAGSTLAGSAQSIASAFTQVPLLAGVNTILTSGTDLNTVTTVGTYNASNSVAGSLINGPDGVTLRAFRMTVERALGTASEWYRQTIILGASVYSGYRRYTAGGSTWSAWEKIPERADIESSYSLSEGPRPEADTDWNTLTDPGTFFFNAVPTGNNKPIADKGKLIVERRLYNVRDVRQTFYPSTQSNGLFFVRTGSTNGTWEAWEKVPTRAEMNKITDITGIFNTNLTTAGSSTQQYNVPNSSQHLVILQAASRTAHGLYLVSATSSGIMQLTEISKGENVTVTAPSANTLEIVNAYTNACYFNDICLRGSAITVQTAGTNSAQSESI